MSGKQCQSNDECQRDGLGDVCEANVCVKRSSPDGGDGGSCSDSSQCGGGTPRCMNGSCVSTEFAERWMCPAGTPAATDTIQYTISIVDFASRNPIKNVTLKACRTTDAACTSPVAKFTDTNGTGVVTLTLENGFTGYFEATATGWLPSLSVLTRPLTATITDRALPMLTMDILTYLTNSAGVPYDDSKGLAIVDAFDCSGVPAGGVHFTESRGSSTPFYIVDSLPNFDTTVTVYNATDMTADSGFLNIQTGFITFTAYYGVDGTELGTFNAQIRKGTVTFIDMHF